MLCKRGYQPNAEDPDCEPINPTECNQAILSQKMCSGWDLSQYDENIHAIQLNNDCYKYKCKRAEYAFTSTTDHTCIECPSIGGGVHPTDGTCITCKTEYIFDETAHEKNYCVKAIALTQSDLIWGRGKTAKDYEKDKKVTDQCWTKLDPDEYRDCVMKE